MAGDLLLLDREGVILEHVDPYLLTHESVRFVPGAALAMGRALAAGVSVAIVTNQSPIGRGLVSAEFVEEVNQRIRAEVGATAGLAFFVCPHAPARGCDCRKPAPGLLLRAMAQFDRSPGECVMVGDHDTDMLAGRAAGVRQCLHVRTGRQTLASTHADASQPDLMSAVESLLDNDGREGEHG